MEGVAAVTIFSVKLQQLIRKPNAPGGVVAEHFTDHIGSPHTVLIPDIGAGQVAIALFKAEDIALFLALGFQQANLFADILEARQHIAGFQAIMGGDPLRQIHGDDGLDHHRLFRHFAVLCPLGADVVQQQNARLVAGKEHILPFFVFDRNAHPVAVRVGGQQQVRIVPLSVLKAQLHGLPNLRVGIGAGGEIAVRLRLLRHHRHIGVAHFGKGPQHRPSSRAVQGRIDDCRILVHFLTEEDRLGFHILHEGGVGFLRYVGDPALFQVFLKGTGMHIPENIQFFNLRQHLSSRLGGDLAAVGTVNLVAVILAGVVGGGDHHARVRPQVPHGEGHRRHRHQPGPNGNLYPICRKYTGRHTGEHIAFDAAVIADANAGLFPLLVEIIRQTLGGLCHRVDVHPVGSGADHTPQAAGSEGQVPVKRVLRLLPGHCAKGVLCFGIHSRPGKPAVVFL